MKFFEYLLSESINNSDITRMNKELDKRVIMIGNSLKVKEDNRVIIDNIRDMKYEDVLQKAKDFIDKNYAEEYNLKDKLNFLTYTEVINNDVDLHLSVNSRLYSHKPLICFIRNDISHHRYVIGYHHEDIQKAVDYIGSPKEGYTIKILDGKFKATKVKLDDGITAYVLDYYYPLRHSDGSDELYVGEELKRIKHIRRKI